MPSEETRGTVCEDMAVAMRSELSDDKLLLLPYFIPVQGEKDQEDEDFIGIMGQNNNTSPLYPNIFGFSPYIPSFALPYLTTLLNLCGIFPSFYFIPFALPDFYALLVVFQQTLYKLPNHP